MRDYKELLGLVTKAELGAPKPSVNYVKIDAESGEPLSVSSPKSFPQLLNTVAKFDSTAQPSRQRKSQQAAPAPYQKPSPPPPPPPAPVAVPRPTPVQSAEPKKGSPLKMPELHFNLKFPKPLNSQPKPPQQAVPTPPVRTTAPPIRAPAPVPKPSPAVQPPSKPSLEESAAKELTKVMKSADIKPAPQPQPIEIPKPPAKKLVLPSLSLTDQVVELDKIIENINKGRFDKSQMEIVKEEVKGLADLLSSQPQSSASLSEFDQDLQVLRKARLSAVLSMIGGL